MTLTVEDGTGLVNADSYCSVETADAYHDARGNAGWAGLSSTVKEQCLRRATDYMNETYRTQWAGSRVYSHQALDWPRYGVEVDGFSVDPAIVPVSVATACAILALKASTETLGGDLDRTIIREKVGPIETEWAPGAPEGRRYVAVAKLIAPYLSGATGAYCARLRRA